LLGREKRRQEEWRKKLHGHRKRGVLGGRRDVVLRQRKKTPSGMGRRERPKTPVIKVKGGSYSGVVKVGGGEKKNLTETKDRADTKSKTDLGWEGTHGEGKE